MIGGCTGHFAGPAPVFDFDAVSASNAALYGEAQDSVH